MIVVPPRLDAVVEPLVAALDGGATVLVTDDTRVVAAARIEEPCEAALLVTTSGTTGPPKVVELSAASLLASARATHEVLGGPGEWALHLPLTFIAGLQVAVRSIVAGPGAPRRYTAVVPTQLRRMMADLRAFDAVLVGGAIVGFGGRGLPVASTPAPTTLWVAGSACAPAVLAARIDHWEGAAGHRIASVELTSSAAGPCALLEVTRVTLVGRNGSPLINGEVRNVSSVSIAPGEKLQTLVEDGNYCGTGAQEPLTLVFEFGAAGRVTAAPSTGGLSGDPGCNGPGQPGTIDMQPWTR